MSRYATSSSGRVVSTDARHGLPGASGEATTYVEPQPVRMPPVRAFKSNVPRLQEAPLREHRVRQALESLARK